MLRRINCRSENSKGVYCLQYDDGKIVSGLRDNTIKIWDRTDLQCVKVRYFPFLQKIPLIYDILDSDGAHWLCAVFAVR